MSEHEVQRPAGEWPTRRPGHELCAARERVGISREDIARTLHLPAEQVDALEADDYARLPPPAYVRGYLRAYAREVGMDPDQVVADYDAVCGEAEDPELVVQYGQPDVSTGRGPGRARRGVVAGARVGAAAGWLQQPALSPIVTQEGAATGTAEPAMDTAEPASANEAGEAATVAEAEEPAMATGPEEPATTEPTEADEPAIPEAPETDETAVAEAGTGDDATAAAADGGTGAGADTDGAGADGTPAAGTGTETAEATAATEPPAEEEVPETMVAEESELPTATSRAELVATEAAGVGPDRLVVDVDGESWLEVFDSRGRQLAYTLYSGDEPVGLNGWAPFDVFLGNAPDVTLRFQGSEIDHSAFVRSDNTARFLVDSEGARRR